MRFVKMHGCRNAYVFIDGRRELVESPAELAVAMADPKRGIGSDGLIIIQPSDMADVRMEMYNADGSRGVTCGNGLRCLARYVLDENPAVGAWCTAAMPVGQLRKTLGEFDAVASAVAGIPSPVGEALGRGIDAFGLADCSSLAVRGVRVRTDAGAGDVWALWTPRGAEMLTVDMGIPKVARADEPGGVGPAPAAEQRLVVDGETYAVLCVDTGNHHVVVFVDRLDEVDVSREGPRLERGTAFSDRANVHFVAVESRDVLRVLHWERGSGITPGCGSGAVAAVVAAWHTGRTEASCRVEQSGGFVRVDVGERVLLSGRAEYVSQGAWRDGRAVYD